MAYDAFCFTLRSDRFVGSLVAPDLAATPVSCRCKYPDLASDPMSSENGFPSRRRCLCIIVIAH